MSDCLNTIVGLSNTDCSCLETNRPEGFDTSLSGFYIDDTEFSIPLAFANDSSDCESGGLWDMLATARSRGLSEFRIKYNAHLGKYAKERHKRYRGRVTIDTTKLLAGQGSSYYGAKIFSQNHKGTIFEITSIGLKLAGAETVTIDVSGTSVEVTTTANAISRATLADPITLELTDDLGRPVDHVISYQANSMPYKTPIYCNCSGKLPPFENIAQYRGFESESSDPDDDELTRHHSYGLIIEGAFKCDPLSWLCDDDMNFTTNPHGRLIARTIQLCQINSFLRIIEDSSKVNRFTILENPDKLYYNLERNEALIMQNLEWFGQNLPYDLQSCYVCKPKGTRKFLRV